MHKLVLTHYDIEAFVDSQLDWETQKQVWRQINEDPACLAQYEQLLRQKKLLLAWAKSEEEVPLRAENPPGKGFSMQMFKPFRRSHFGGEGCITDPELT